MGMRFTSANDGDESKETTPTTRQEQIRQHLCRNVLDRKLNRIEMFCISLVEVLALIYCPFPNVLFAAAPVETIVCTR